jgi:hypothetical protein
MTDTRLDPWRDRMVQALCGELDDDQRAELEAAVQADPELLSDWRELEQAHAALAVLDTPAGDGGFEFAMPPDTAGVPRTRTWWRWAASSAIGFAAAASVFLALLVAGLRIDRTPGGLLVGFGPLEAATSAAPATGASSPVTRAELALFAQELVGATAARLDELERRQTTTQAEATRALFGALSERQQLHYDDLRSRIDLAAFRRGQTLQQH